jgi:MSHA biogenesis protein MshL
MENMKRTSVLIFAVVLGACAEQPYTPNRVDPGILAEMDKVSQPGKPSQPDAVRDALLPSLRIEMPRVSGAPVEPRFDLVVNAAPAPQVFMSIVSGTRYSMVVNPSVSGAISVNLKDVTIREALEAIRESYGFEFRIDGTRIYVDAAGLQTRVYQVNYLTALRTGRSDVRVSSGAISGNIQPSGTSSPPTSGGTVPIVPGGVPGTTPGSSQMLGALGVGTIATTTFDASRISTLSQNDFWTEVNTALRTLVGTGEGRNVVISPQSGVIVVRAMPGELRSVEAYLKAMRFSIDRQVMIEAKIVDVTLNDSYQTGINWAAFPTSGQSFGQVSTGTILQKSGTTVGGGTLATGAGGITRDPGATVFNISAPSVSTDPGQNLLNISNPAASLFGLAFQTTNFAALLTFLQTQGAVQVLSSPRIATLNNQKAVLKVGTDQFFVTAVTSTPITGVNGAVTSVSVTPTVSPFFSGVSLDITPQIDEDGNIMLHIHPLVSKVTGQDFPFNFGAGVGTQDLQLASSAINESDTVVRIQDGNIVVLGGLMQTDVETNRSGLPGLQDIPGIGGAFRSTTRTTTKRELVVLLKPTIIKTEKDWEQDIQQTRDRMRGYGANVGSDISK